MTTSRTEERSLLDPDMTPMTLTERHLKEWLELLDYLRETHAPMDRLNYCRNQVTRLQLEFYQLQNPTRQSA